MQTYGYGMGLCWGLAHNVTIEIGDFIQCCVTCSENVTYSFERDGSVYAGIKVLLYRQLNLYYQISKCEVESVSYTHLTLPTRRTV